MDDTNAVSVIITQRNIRNYLAMMAQIYTADGHRTVELMLYGGGALILASNFRESTNDLDCFVNNDKALPVRENKELQTEAMTLAQWAKDAVGDTSNGKGWLDSSIYMVFEHCTINLAARQNHIYLETITAESPIFRIWVPDKDLMLAMKVNSMRIDKKEDGKKAKDLQDLLNLLALHPAIKNGEELIDFSARFFPWIKGRQDVIDGAKRLFSDEFRDTPRHAQPRYSSGSHLES